MKSMDRRGPLQHAGGKIENLKTSAGGARL